MQQSKLRAPIKSDIDKLNKIFNNNIPPQIKELYKKTNGGFWHSPSGEIYTILSVDDLIHKSNNDLIFIAYIGENSYICFSKKSDTYLIYNTIDHSILKRRSLFDTLNEYIVPVISISSEDTKPAYTKTDEQIEKEKLNLLTPKERIAYLENKSKEQQQSFKKKRLLAGAVGVLGLGGLGLLANKIIRNGGNEEAERDRIIQQRNEEFERSQRANKEENDKIQQKINNFQQKHK